MKYREQIEMHLFHYICNETDKTGKRIKSKMPADVYCEHLAEGTLVDEVPEAKPYVELLEEEILKEAAEILTRSYRSYDTRIIERLAREKRNEL